MQTSNTDHILSYGVYAAILFGTFSVIVISTTVILLKLSLPRLVALLESFFRFKEVRRIGKDYIVIDVCNDYFELVNTISSRLPFIFAVGMCLLVSVLVFIEGCIFSTRHFYSSKACSTRTPYCFLFQSDLSQFRPLYKFECVPDQPVVPTNMSASYAVCYGFVLPDQSSVDILNQLGVCTGILSLVESFYPVMYKFARRKGGRIGMVILLIILVVIETVVLSIQLNVSFMTIILLTLVQVLLLNILFLQYRKTRSPPNLCRIGTYIELDDVN